MCGVHSIGRPINSQIVGHVISTPLGRVVEVVRFSIVHSIKGMEPASHGMHFDVTESKVPLSYKMRLVAKLLHVLRKKLKQKKGQRLK